ncbi:hypothetical protein K1719_033819 [Acacia pycnantha]|nr:hypothetical protein K1719_033819 [Acacia pycnantha]
MLSVIFPRLYHPSFSFSVSLEPSTFFTSFFNPTTFSSDLHSSNHLSISTLICSGQFRYHQYFIIYWSSPFPSMPFPQVRRVDLS